MNFMTRLSDNVSLINGSSSQTFGEKPNIFK